MPRDPTPPHGPAPTRWSQVWRAGFGTPEEQRRAMEEICRAYWLPVFRFARRHADTQEQAEDLAQGFFAHFLERDLIKEANAAKGRLRGFVFLLLERYIISNFKKTRTQKRGGGVVHVPLSDNGDSATPADNLTPEKLFNRQWALATLEQAMEDTLREAERMKKEAIFHAVRCQLSLDGLEAETTERLAEELKMSEAAVRTAAHRWRKRFLANFRQRVALSIDSCDSKEVDEEIRNLRSFL
ncbi:MAG: sigma-70 family RNA polymerase sigma factor [Verrucomicrobiales bacterium]|nr:sigma-70 family RNA polymerase sigma factor [Verrucomicrobiales bacterium]